MISTILWYIDPWEEQVLPRKNESVNGIPIEYAYNDGRFYHEKIKGNHINSYSSVRINTHNFNNTTCKYF